MPETMRPSSPRWSTSQSIVLELDAALTALNGYYAPGALPPDILAVIAPAQPDWQANWGRVIAEPDRNVDLLETLAVLAGVLLEEDYSAATLAIRELTVETALARLAAEGSGAAEQEILGQAADTGATPVERLVRLAARRQAGLFEAAGFAATSVANQARRQEAVMRRAVRVLTGGDLHARFWHWLDRFYYEAYHPWRLGRAPVLAQAERRLRSVLGQGAEGPVDPAWLPPQNPLLRLPELRAAYDAGLLSVVCWVEPLGLADAWSLYSPPGSRERGEPMMLVTATAEPGQIYENFRAVASDVASRAAALGDPTRLIILRMIRNFGMFNTELAEYLGLARPTVSIHAKVLRDAGLIRSRQEGRLVRHEIIPEEVRRLFHDLERFLDLPD